METDRELLELAAKAAGIACDERGPYTESPCMQSEFGRGNWIENVRRDWSPLTDDGDALRLAASLEISVMFSSEFVNAIATQHDDDGVVPFAHESWTISNQDCYAATRRAIVRCAAAIGRTK